MAILWRKSGLFQKPDKLGFIALLDIRTDAVAPIASPGGRYAPPALKQNDKRKFVLPCEKAAAQAAAHWYQQ